MKKTSILFINLVLLTIVFSPKAYAVVACGTGTYCPNNTYTCNTTTNKCCGSGTPACGNVCCASNYCVSGVCKEPFVDCPGITPYCKVGQCQTIDDPNLGPILACLAIAGVDNSNLGTAPLTPIDGACVSYPNPIPTIPTNLCLTGTASPTTPLGAGNPWTWQCMGQNGGSDSPQCTATSSATVGECVTTNPPSSTPPTNRCSKGTPTSPQPVNTTWVWRCLGSITNADCSSTRIIGPVCNNNTCEGAEACEFSAGGTGIACPGRTALPAGQTCSATCTITTGGPPPVAQTYTVNALPIGLRFGNIADLITFIIKAVLGFSGAGFLIMILYGAFKYTTSQGDKAGVTEAQKTISSAVIGLAIASAFFAIISLLQTVLGVSLFNITI